MYVFMYVRTYVCMCVYVYVCLSVCLSDFTEIRNTY